MRKHFIILNIIACLTVVSNAVNGQILPSLGCNDKSIRLQAEQYKQDFKAQGQEVYRDAMLNMESRQPTPVAIQLNKGVLYQMIFIGSHDANKINFELYDGEDRKIDEKILKMPGISNFVVYSFVPEKTDLYLVILTQVKGTQSLCGSFTIMQPGTNKTKTTTPAAPKQQPAKATNNPRYIPQNR
eukprot:TRINITY_DN66985_c0_g1_i1.p1 TRINITY_DN66985_c0_g1~~TRINITY_DN66985_c0_g1_i1.p1  ORF type:complete len:185 (+),score=18.59 TRINITY_DN66985_c0_g1_i1:274-828(+)